MVPTKNQALIVEPGVRLSFVIDGICAICLWARHDNEARCHVLATGQIIGYDLDGIVPMETSWRR